MVKPLENSRWSKLWNALRCEYFTLWYLFNSRHTVFNVGTSFELACSQCRLTFTLPIYAWRTLCMHQGCPSNISAHVHVRMTAAVPAQQKWRFFFVYCINHILTITAATANCTGNGKVWQKTWVKQNGFVDKNTTESRENFPCGDCSQLWNLIWPSKPEKDARQNCTVKPGLPVRKSQLDCNFPECLLTVVGLDPSSPTQIAAELQQVWEPVITELQQVWERVGGLGSRLHLLRRELGSSNVLRFQHQKWQCKCLNIEAQWSSAR